jgi:hypothetical protein
MDTSDTSNPIAQLKRQIFDYFYQSIQKRLQHTTYPNVWTTMVRLFLTRHKLCQNCANTDIHFHDSLDWYDQDLQQQLHEFWTKWNNADAKNWVQSVSDFATRDRLWIQQQLDASIDDMKTHLTTLIDAQTQESIELMLQENWSDDFLFHSAWVCTLMNMESAKQTGSVQTDWLYVCFRYFLQFFLDSQNESDEECSGSDDGDSESDVCEEDTDAKT